MKIVIAFLNVMLASGVFAATHYVDVAGNAPFTQVQPAINAASAGDTIVVAPGFGYQGFTVDRRLIVVGAGTSGLHTRIDGSVTVSAAADSSELWSLAIVNALTGGDSANAVLRISGGAVGIFVHRCLVLNTYSTSYLLTAIYLGSGCECTFNECVVSLLSTNASRGIQGTVGNIACTFNSCLFSGCRTILHKSSGTGSVTLRNCLSVISLQGSSQLFVLSSTVCGQVTNSAFLNTGTNGSLSYTGVSCLDYRWSAFFPTAPPAGEGNIACSTMDFVQYNAWSQGDYHLSMNSALRDAGDPNGPPDLDSTRADIGIYGGMHPYVDGGIPPFPFVLDLDVPTAVPQNGAVRVWARGRVGPTH